MFYFKPFIYIMIVCLSSPLFAHNLTLSCPQGNNFFSVEFARTPEELGKGLMFRTDLAEDQGMLFLFPKPEPTTMWMKNTPLPLDMIFCNAEGKILAIHENTIPFSTHRIGPVEGTLQVLEVRAGTVEKHSISKKCTLTLHP